MPKGLSLPDVRGWFPAAGAFALVAATGFAQGGYFPGSWGWAMLAAGWAAAVALLARERTELSKSALAMAALLAGFALWTALSASWSIDVTDSVLEAERTAVYVAVLLAALLCAGRKPERLLHGAWAATVALCGWGLLTRLVPDRWGVIDTISRYRLSEPVGYWNSLGLLAAMGSLLALGIVTRARTPAWRAIAAASLPVLVTTLYFTYSRGAWLALASGLVAMLGVDVRRAQLALVGLGTAPFVVLAVWRASVSTALTTFGAPLAAQAHAGHRLLLLLAALAAGSGLAGLGAARLGERLHVPRGIAFAGAAVAVAAIVAGFVQYGSPWSLAQRGWDSFAGSGPPTTTLNGRLFNLSGTGRATQWRIATHEVADYPALGSGAASFETYWNRNRPVPSRIRNVHNLYLETLAGLGPVGLGLLLGVLLVPLSAAFSRRTSPLVPAAFGALVAYALHVVVDWDWQIASVTFVPLLAAAALLAGGAPVTRRARRAGVALAGVLLVTSVYTVATRIPLSQLDRAAAKGQWTKATRDARRASALAPWSYEPWMNLGEDELDAGRKGPARRAFEKALAIDDRHWVAWYDLARTTSGGSRRRALARARALNPLGPETASFGK